MNDMTLAQVLAGLSIVCFGFAVLAWIVDLFVGHGEKERGNREVISHR